MSDYGIIEQFHSSDLVVCDKGDSPRIIYIQLSDANAESNNSPQISYWYSNQ